METETQIEEVEVEDEVEQVALDDGNDIVGNAVVANAVPAIADNNVVNVGNSNGFSDDHLQRACHQLMYML